MKGPFLLLIAIITEVIASSLLPITKEFTQIAITLIVIACYLCSLYFMTLSLKYIPLGVSYAVWAGLGMVGIAITSWYFHDQKLDLPSIIGIMMIIGGVLVINLFSKLNLH